MASMQTESNYNPIDYPSTLRSGIYSCTDCGHVSLTSRDRNYHTRKLGHMYWQKHHELGCGDWVQNATLRYQKACGFREEKRFECRDCGPNTSNEETVEDHELNEDHRFNQMKTCYVRDIYVCKDCGNGTSTKRGNDSHVERTGHNEGVRRPLVVDSLR